MGKLHATICTERLNIFHLQKYKMVNNNGNSNNKQKNHNNRDNNRLLEIEVMDKIMVEDNVTIIETTTTTPTIIPTTTIKINLHANQTDHLKKIHGVQVQKIDLPENHQLKVHELKKIRFKNLIYPKKLLILLQVQDVPVMLQIMQCHGKTKKE